MLVFPFYFCIAVQVQSVTINQGSHRLTNGQHVQVDQNVPTTFTCITGTSKPASTINWFIGFAKHIQTGSTFTYTPVNADHDSSIYCAAYNIQPESRAIQSQKPKLFVRGEYH